MPPTPIDEFQAIVLARELARRPDIAHLARTLYFINMPTGSVVEQTPTIYLNLAKQLVDDAAKRQNFLMALDIAVVRK